MAYINRGLVYSNKNEFDKAVKSYNEAIRLDPQVGYRSFKQRHCIPLQDGFRQGNQGLLVHPARPAITVLMPAGASYALP